MIKYLLSICIIVNGSLSLFAQELTSSNLPIIVINTDGPGILDEHKVPATMRIIFNESGEINKITDTDFHYDGRIGIEHRGQSSLQLFPKKGYGLETREKDGSNRNVSLFGWPKENDYVIHSPYSDKSLIRNSLTYGLAANIMKYAPRTQHCELMINGEYLGVVVMVEKIKRDKGRVDISKLDSDDNAGDSLTGGYILRFDKHSFNDVAWISPYKPNPNSSQETRFIYHYPKVNDITDFQKNYIQNYITEFENVLAGNNFKDSLVGYSKYIDADSFIDLMIINELTRNVDGYRLSTYMYKDKEGKLNMGPVWDFNLALGNADYCSGSNISGWAFNFNDVCPDDFWINHFWWKRLLDDEKYAAKFEKRWNELRLGILSDQTVSDRIDAYANILQQPQVRNFQKWDILTSYIWPNNQINDTYIGEVNYVENWIHNRMEWIDNNISSLVPFTSSCDENNSTSDNLLLFPNPATTSVSYCLTMNECIDCQVNFYNMDGQLAKSEYINRDGTIPLFNMNGMYIYQLVDKEGYVLEVNKISIAN